MRAPSASGSDPEERGQGDRIVALLGIARGPGTVALVGAPARHAELLLERVPDLAVVAVDADTASWPERPRVSRMAAWPRLPFLPAGLRGVAIDGRLGSALLFEAARVTARMSRTLVVNADEGAADVLREAGLEVLAEEPGTVVAARG